MIQVLLLVVAAVGPAPGCGQAQSAEITGRLVRVGELLRQGLADEALLLCDGEAPLSEAVGAAGAPDASRGPFEPWRASVSRLTGGLWTPRPGPLSRDEYSLARLAYGRGICLRSGAQPVAAVPVATPVAAPSVSGSGDGPPSPLELATEAFGTARSLAGPGYLRQDAVDNLAQLAFAVGELWRAQIPELSGGAATGHPGQGSQPTAAGGEQQVEPLEAARAAYMTAREQLIELLQLVDAEERRGANTRALTELVLRRLRELEDIERQRQESEEEQEGEEGEEGEEGGDSEQEQEGESEEEQQEPEDGEGEDEQQPEEGEDEQSQAGEEEAEEQVMTREEVMRLLQALEQIEAEGEELQERLRRMRRVPGDKDW